MAYPKGRPRPKGAGRKKGTPNKTTTAIREALLQSFENVGGVEYLEDLARTEPKAYASLVGKLIPNEVLAKVETTKRIKVVDLSGGESDGSEA